MTKRILTYLLFASLAVGAGAQEKNDSTETYLNGVVPTTGYNCFGQHLHEGLNVSLGASVSAAWGKYAPKGAGFSESVNLTYLKALNKHASLAVSGYVSNTDWDKYSFRAGGISALFNYRFNEHWEAYAYVQKNFMDGNPWGPFGGYGYRYNGIMSPYYYGAYNPAYAMMSPWGYGMGPMWPGCDHIGAGVRYNFNEKSFIEVSVDIPVNNQRDAFHQRIR